MVQVTWERYRKGIWRRPSSDSPTGYIYRGVRQAGKDESGKYRQQVKHAPRLKDIELWRSDGHVKLDSGTLDTSKDSLQDLYDRLHREQDYAKATLRWHADLWACVPDRLKNRPAKDIPQREVARFLADIEAPTMRERVRGLGSELYRYGGLAVNPFAKTHKPTTRKARMAAQSNMRGRYREDAEVEGIIRNTPERYRALVHLLWRVGLRPGEALALTVGQVDPETRVLTIDRGVNDGELEPTKTGRVRRPTLPAVVFEGLSDHIRRYSDWTNPEALVFTTPEGTMVDSDNFRSRIFKVAAVKAGVNHDVSPMDLRHTAASNMIASGVDVVTVAQYTGHSVQVLVSTYAHYVEEAGRRAAELLDAAFTKAPGSSAPVA
jgi:integrase